MSKNNDYQPNPAEEFLGARAAAERPGADLRLRLLTLRDLAHAFLEELRAVGQPDDAAGGVEQGVDFYDEVRRFEIELIRTALRHTNGVQTEAATLLGLKPTTLHAKLKQYNLSPADFGARASVPPRETSARDAYREPARGESDEGVRVLA